ncbi:MAG: type II toxin-antitoxin system RelE/ParE family toxin [Micropruina sp.]
MTPAKYRVLTEKSFDRAISRLDRTLARRILKALIQLEELDDPTKRCKALSGPLTGLWRLRVGDYRIILDIRRTDLVVVALDAANRSSIYD